MLWCSLLFFFFFFQAEDGIRDKLVTGVQTCALPICLLHVRHRLPRGVHLHRSRREARGHDREVPDAVRDRPPPLRVLRSEEHTSELQSLAYLVCRLLLEKKKKKQKHHLR